MQLFPPQHTNRLHGLDHLRTIAIVLVMLFHYSGDRTPGWIMPVKDFGWTGVDLFFVLSGYLIGHALLKEMATTQSLSLRQFYLKRFFRILPAYFFVLILYYAVPVLQEGRGLPPVWRFITFTQNIGMDVQHQNTFSHAWSLCIEEQFYCILPLTIILLYALRVNKHAYLLLIILFIAGFAIRHYSWIHYVQPLEGDEQAYRYMFSDKVYYPTYCRLDGLLVGLAVAGLVVFKPGLSARLMRRGNLLFSVSVILIAATFILCRERLSYQAAVFGFPLVSIAFGVLVFAAISPTCFLFKFKSRVTYVLATLSYSIYLIHKQMYHVTRMVLHNLEIELTKGQTYMLCITVALLAAFVLYIIIEIPFLKLRNRIVAAQKINPPFPS